MGQKLLFAERKVFYEGKFLLISIDTTIVATSQHMSSELGGEAIILDLQRGMYYGLSGVGAYIWGALQQPQLVRDLRDAILNDYDVAPEQCERDLIALLHELAATGLIEVRDVVAA